MSAKYRVFIDTRPEGKGILTIATVPDMADNSTPIGPSNIIATVPLVDAEIYTIEKDGTISEGISVV